VSDPRDEQVPAPPAGPGDAGSAADAGEVTEHDLREAGLTDDAKQEGLS
jgi:hypothetical protein